ncbi:MAG: hypothetical protein NT165_03625 [Candidatus Falkowbacteria bacterium]|nr:hypothetical protein [Candidatus Falkowbacteria bacterium]
MIFKDPTNDPDDETEQFDAPDEDTLDLMKNYDIDLETAEHVQEIMDELGVDEDEAVELEEIL